MKFPSNEEHKPNSINGSWLLKQLIQFNLINIEKQHHAIQLKPIKVEWI